MVCLPGSLSGLRGVAAGTGGPTAPPAALDRGDSGHSGSLGAQGEGSQQESPLPRLSGQEQGRREQSSRRCCRGNQEAR